MAKLQRWVDLLAALLRRKYPVTLEELEREVPGYARIEDKESRRRAFERDKDELRSFGVPLETVMEDEVAGYRLERKRFYLPYVSVLRDAQPTPVRTASHPWYHGLQRLAFEADELEALAEAAARVRQLDVPMLTELVDSCMRKLAFDLPTDVSVREVEQEPGEITRLRSPVSTYVRLEMAAPRARAPRPNELFEELDGALQRRKRVTITYQAMGAAEPSERDVMPYGLFFLGQHWYLAARERDDGPVKNFRLSRITDATVNGTKPLKPDYEIPADFRLPDHARSRSAWELGDTAAVEVVVRFTGASGPTHAAMRLGVAADDDPALRRFNVRRQDTFLRWLLSFAGEAEPVSPPEFVEGFQRLAREALAVYGADR